MATFERLGPALVSSEQKRAFVSIIHAMRKDGANHAASVSDRDILRVIFGSED